MGIWERYEEEERIRIIWGYRRIGKNIIIRIKIEIRIKEIWIE